MKFISSTLALIALAVFATACGQKEDRVACREDIPALRGAIDRTEVTRGSLKAELHDDLNELGAEKGCPENEGDGDD